MTLGEIFGAIKKKMWLIMSLTVILAMAGLFATWQIAQKYEVGCTATINKTSSVNQQDVDYYLYDDYYSIQAGAFVADNIVSWLTNAPTVVSIYKASGNTLPTENMKTLAKTFEAKKVSSNGNVVTYKTTNTDPDTASELLASANSYIVQEISDLNAAQAEQNEKFTVSFSDTAAVQVPKSYLLNTLLGGLLGMFLGLTAAVYRKVL